MTTMVEQLFWNDRKLFCGLFLIGSYYADERLGLWVWHLMSTANNAPTAQGQSETEGECRDALWAAAVAYITEQGQ